MNKIKTLTVNGESYQIWDQEAARIDDSKTGPDAWSGKNTADKLCPAFSERGSVATCAPVEGYPLGVVSHIDASREPLGKNLYNVTGEYFSAYINESYSAWFNSEDSYSVKIKCLPNMPYTLSGIRNIGIVRIATMEKDATPDSGPQVSVLFSTTTNADNAITVVTGESANYMIVQLTRSSDKSLVQLEQNAVATDYEPFLCDTTARLQRCGKNLLSDDWKDVSNWSTLDSNSRRFLLDVPPGQYCIHGEFDTTSERYVYLEKSTDGGQTWTVEKVADNGIGGYIIALKNPCNIIFTVTDDPNETWSLWTRERDIPYILALQLESGSVATAYEPYCGETFAVDIGQWIRGSSFDWGKGILTDADGNETQLTPQEILALPGTNILYSDTGDTTVTGRAILNAEVEDLYSRVASLEVSVRLLEQAVEENTVPAYDGTITVV